MYLVRLPNGQPVTWLFVHADPREENCPFPVQINVEFEDDRRSDSVCQDMEGVLGRSIVASNRYRRFHGDHVPSGQSFELILGKVMECSTWGDFLKQRNGAAAIMMQAFNANDRKD